MKSRVRLERFYNLKKESLRVFVVLGGVDPKLIRPDNAMRTNVVIRL